MHTPLMQTKLMPPRRRPDLLSRGRLIDLLFTLLDLKLILIAAPPGYGKTTLLVDAVHRVALPACWYALDALDAHPPRFIAYLIAAIRRCFPAFGQQSGALLASMPEAAIDIDRLVATIVNEAVEQIHEHFVVVIDDYHFVDGNETIDCFVSQLVQRMDENCHVVLVSRTLPALPDLPLMVARSQVGGLSLDELAFRPDEIQALVLQNYHQTIPPSAAEELVRETEGWITGLLLSAQTMWQGMADRLRLARVSGVGLYDYLAQQVLNQQPPEVRDFLLRTAFLEEFDADLCEATLGPAPVGDGWHGVIETVLRHNLFVLPVGERGLWLRYHHLFRDFLQATLTREQPAEAARVQRQLGAVYRARGDWEKAHALFTHVGDIEAAAEMIEQAGPALARGGRFSTLREWLGALPPETVVARPALLSLRGMVLAAVGEVGHGLALFNQAAAAFRDGGETAHLARTLVRRAVAHRFLGHYQQALQDADEALALAAADPALRAVEAEACKVRGSALHRLGRPAAAIEWLTRALHCYEAVGDRENVAVVQMDIGIAERAAGRYAAARLAYDQALAYWRGVDNLTWQANLLNNLGVLHHLQGDYLRALALLEEALAAATRSGYVRMEAFILTSIGDLYADLDARDAARAAYEEARARASTLANRFLHLYLDLADVALARMGGALAEARATLARLAPTAAEGGSLYEQGLFHLEVGRVSLAEGGAAQARAPLETALRAFDEGGQPLEAARAALLLAVACHGTGDGAGAQAGLVRAFSLVAVAESRHALIVVGREAKALLEAAQHEATIGTEAALLLAQVNDFEAAIPSFRRRLRLRAPAIPLGSPMLAIQALGGGQVTVDGRPVAGSDWQTQAARDLFFCLLAHPDGLTKEAVGAIFWPESSPAQLKLQFKNTLYRLRHALGQQEVILFDDNRYTFNWALDYRYDVEALQSGLVLAEAAPTPAAQIAAYSEALQHYRGAYLPETDGAWALAERERLWQIAAAAMLRLAGLQLAQGGCESALESCRRLLAEDPCLEEAHRLAMRAHAALGNRAALVRQFERCRQLLSDEMGVPPSPQTELLYQTLTR